MLCSSYLCTFLIFTLTALQQRLGSSDFVNGFGAIVNTVCDTTAPARPTFKFGPQPCCDLIVFRPVFGPPTFYDLAIYIPPQPTSTIPVHLPPTPASLSVVAEDCDHVHTHTPHPAYVWIADRTSAAAQYLDGWTIEMSGVSDSLDRVGRFLDMHSYVVMPALLSFLALLAICSIANMAMRIYRASAVGTPMVHPFNWAIGTTLVAYYHTIGITIASAIHCASFAVVGLTATIRGQNPPIPTTIATIPIPVPVPETSGAGTNTPSPLSTDGPPGDVDGSLALDEAPVPKMTEQERLKAILGPVVKVGGCRQRQKKRTKKCSSK